MMRKYTFLDFAMKGCVLMHKNICKLFRLLCILEFIVQNSLTKNSNLALLLI